MESNCSGVLVRKYQHTPERKHQFPRSAERTSRSPYTDQYQSECLAWGCSMLMNTLCMDTAPGASSVKATTLRVAPMDRTRPAINDRPIDYHAQVTWQPRTVCQSVANPSGDHSKLRTLWPLQSSDTDHRSVPADPSQTRNDTSHFPQVPGPKIPLDTKHRRPALSH
jgi:hypothetical protein